jgi:hypothetical protein
MRRIVCALALFLACFSALSWAQLSPSSLSGPSSPVPPYLSIPFPPQLGPQSIAPRLPPSSAGQPQALTQDPPLYTEAQAQAAIREAAAVAARAAVAEAVPQAVAIALKDYARAEGLKLSLWRVGTLSGVLGVVGALLAPKAWQGAGIGAGIGAVAGSVWMIAERWPPRFAL